MNRLCLATTLKGGQCSGRVPDGKYHFWYHDPANAGKRRCVASKVGKGNRSKVSKDLHHLLQDLTEQVISGELESYSCSVAGQLIRVRIRLLEFERKVKETDVLEDRLEDLEEFLKDRRQERSGYGA